MAVEVYFNYGQAVVWLANQHASSHNFKRIQTHTCIRPETDTPTQFFLWWAIDKSQQTVFLNNLLT